MIWILTIGALILAVWSASHFVMNPVAEFIFHHPLREQILRWARPFRLPRTLGNMVMPLLLSPVLVWMLWHVRSVVQEQNPGVFIGATQTLGLVRLGMVESVITAIVRRSEAPIDPARLAALASLLDAARDHFCPWLIVQR